MPAGSSGRRQRPLLAARLDATGLSVESIVLVLGLFVNCAGGSQRTQ